MEAVVEDQEERIEDTSGPRIKCLTPSTPPYGRSVARSWASSMTTGGSLKGKPWQRRKLQLQRGLPAQRPLKDNVGS